MPSPCRNNSRKHHRLGIQRPSIGSNSLATKYALNIYSPRFIESHTSSLHDDVYIALSVLVQTCSRITRFDILGQVEVRTV
jgi:hypothetical protein